MADGARHRLSTGPHRLRFACRTPRAVAVAALVSRRWGDGQQLDVPTTARTKQYPFE